MSIHFYHRPKAEALSLSTGEFSGNVSIKNKAELRFYDNGNYVGFEAPDLSADQIWILPTADGTSTQVLRTDGSGTLSWASAAAGTGQVELDDTDASHQLIFDWSEDAGADYTLDWKVGGANRTITLNENFTIGDGTDITITGVTAARTITLNENLTIGGGTDITITGVTAARTITLNENLTIGDGTDITITGVTAARTLTMNENLTVGGGSDVTVTAEDAAGTVTLDNINFEVEDEVGSGNTIKIVNATSDASRTITLSEDLTIADGQNITLHASGGEGAQLAIDTQNAERTLDMSGNLTVTGASTVNQNVSTTGDPTFNDVVADKLECNECFTFDAVQTATGDGTTTVDWGLGNVMYFTFGAQADTFTFTAPPGVAMLRLVLKQDATGSRTATWPGTVLWPGNVAPTLSTGANEVDIVSMLWDGTSYHGVANYDFS